MFLTIAIVLALLWLAGFLFLPSVGAMIHLLLVLAIIALVYHFIRDAVAAPRV